MYVRIATAQIKPGKLGELSDQMVHVFEQGIAQGIQVPGFLGHQFLINRDLNKIAIVSRWESEAAETANRQGSAQRQFERLGDQFAELPTMEVYELRFEV